MREEDFKAWLAAEGAQSDKAIAMRLSRLRRLERAMTEIGLPFTDFDQAFATDRFATVLSKLSELREDARSGGLQFRALLPETTSADTRLVNLQSLLRRYGRFLAGEQSGQTISNAQLDELLFQLTRDEIDAAIEECVEVGTEEFLLNHGFKRPRRWIQDGQGHDLYPAKAVVAAAISYLTDGPDLTARTFYAGFGEDKAFAKLAELGYSITPAINAAVAGLTLEAVIAAMDECDHFGLDGFLTRYAFGMPRDYWVKRPDGDTRYPAKAIVGVAYRHMPHGKTKPNSAFNGGNGEQGANTILRRLGFEIVGPDDANLPDLRMSDRIRRFVIDTIIQPARNRGDAEIDIVSGDVHHQMGLDNAMPNVCQVLGGKIFAEEAGVTRVDNEGDRRSSTVRYRFALGRHETSPIWLVTALDGQADGLEGFIERGDWHLLHDNGSKYNRMVREMQPGDRIVMRDFLSNQRNPPFPNNGVPVTAMRIRATGVVTKASEDSLSVAVDWTRMPEERLWWLYTNNDTIWWLPVTESEMARRLEAFIFDGADQDLAWFLNDPYWRGRFVAQTQEKPMASPTNLILYGPPGTGKTYTTARKAVALCDGEDDYPGEETGRTALMERYRLLQKQKRIGFVTFHQNFSYEDFVEGLRPVTGGDEQAGAGFTLKPEPGIFRELCALAERARKHPLENAASADAPNLSSRNFWKMSIGNSGSEDEIYQDAVKGEYIALGWASAEDWTDPRYASMEAIKEQWLSQPRESSEPSNWSQTHRFRNVMQPGDIVIVPYGNSAFRAVGEVTGPYRYDSECDGYYANKRAVRWLLTLDEPLPLDTIVEGNFTMRSLYPLPVQRINIPALTRLIAPAPQNETATADSTVDQFVLIIDEINRANISKVFGELITLIEPDKRLGMPDFLTVKLPYSKTEFGVPANLHIVGTMNTADRSIALLDTALRRRFTFEEMAPDPTLLGTVENIDLQAVLTAINQRIEYLVDREHRIGHAFFMGCSTRRHVDAVMRDKVIPLLQEYFFEDWGRIRAVLGAGFIDEAEIKPPPGFDGQPRKTWSVRSTFKLNAYERLLSGIAPDDDAPEQADEDGEA